MGRTLRRVLLLLVLAAQAPTVAAGQQIPYGPSLVFNAVRDGERIGTHALAFRRDGDDLVVSTSIDFLVKVLGIGVYRYTHRGRETWRGDEFREIETSTDDNGKTYTVRAQRQADGLAVERRGPDAPSGRRDVVPAGLAPSTHWRLDQVRRSSLLNSQKGIVERIAVATIGREAVPSASGSIEATRYRYSGGVRMDQWFDGSGRWVRSTFVVSDGSTIDYALQDGR